MILTRLSLRVAHSFGQTVQLGDSDAAGPLALAVAMEGAQSGLVSSFAARFDPDGICRSAPPLIWLKSVCNDRGNWIILLLCML
jgi:hypothetical protein